MIDINKFCDKDGILHWLTKPFIVEGRLCATNRRNIIIMHNQDLSAYTTPKFNISKIREVIYLIESIEAFNGFSAIDKSQIVLPEKIACEICDGNGKVEKIKCLECSGDGVVDVESDFSTYYDLECASCDAIGYINQEPDKACENCNGEGKVFEFGFIEIMGVKVPADRIKLIINEPDLQFATNENKTMLVFRTGDAIGAIMAVES